MYKVVYKVYGKYVNVVSFDTYTAAKKFFWKMQKNSKITSTELIVPQMSYPKKVLDIAPYMCDNTLEMMI